jgi:hypothetical protein
MSGARAAVAAVRPCVTVRRRAAERAAAAARRADVGGGRGSRSDVSTTVGLQALQGAVAEEAWSWRHGRQGDHCPHFRNKR